MNISLKIEPLIRNNFKIKNFLRNIYYSVNVNNKELQVDENSLKEMDKLYLKKIRV